MSDGPWRWVGGWMFLIFLTLKLTGYITWSWWLVTAPLWIPLILWAVVLLSVLTVAGIAILKLGKK